MEPRSLVGMVSFDAMATAVNDSGRGVPASVEATYMHVLSEVGANYHLVYHEGEDFARLISNEELARHRWWARRAHAVSAFDNHKTSRNTNKP